MLLALKYIMACPVFFERNAMELASRPYGRSTHAQKPVLTLRPRPRPFTPGGVWRARSSRWKRKGTARIDPGTGHCSPFFLTQIVDRGVPEKGARTGSLHRRSPGLSSRLAGVWRLFLKEIQDSALLFRAARIERHVDPGTLRPNTTQPRGLVPIRGGIVQPRGRPRAYAER